MWRPGVARRIVAGAGVALTVLAVGAAAAGDPPRLRLSGELKLNLRHSWGLEYPLYVDVPPVFLPPGEDYIELATPDPGTHLEVSNLSLALDAELGDRWAGRALVHVLDLYYRNPSTMERKVFLREAWLRRGPEDRWLRPLQPDSWYLLVGKAPVFARQQVRNLESYGLWGTAVNRFEVPQVQAGGALSRHLYWRLHAGVGAPLFMRDPNAWAGNNGTNDEIPGQLDPQHGTGFPILYDARPPNAGLSGELEVGGAVGWRLAAGERTRAVDVMLWHFQRDLADEVDIQGSYYEGDLDLVDWLGVGLPVHGRHKRTDGVNVSFRTGRLIGFAQAVDEDIAGLERSGFEVELACHVPLYGLFAWGDRVVGLWLRPALRYSRIDNHFTAPPEFSAPSLAWDWRKLDLGVRAGIVRDVDLTLEVARHDMVLGDGRLLHPDEWLATLRVGF